MMCLVLICLTYMPCNLLLSYIISFLFSNWETAQAVQPLIFFLVRTQNYRCYYRLNAVQYLCPHQSGFVHLSILKGHTWESKANSVSSINLWGHLCPLDTFLVFNQVFNEKQVIVTPKSAAGGRASTFGFRSITLVCFGLLTPNLLYS